MPAGARRAPLPTFLEPSLALLVDKPPGGPQWVHEIKFDGYRIQARIDGEDIRLLTRKTLDWTKRFPTIAAALRRLDTGKALLDGEIVSEDERGIPQFSDLHSPPSVAHAARPPRSSFPPLATLSVRHRPADVEA
jgi:bifunctional non-homologous end joining protein LigD